MNEQALSKTPGVLRFPKEPYIFPSLAEADRLSDHRCRFSALRPDIGFAYRFKVDYSFVLAVLDYPTEILLFVLPETFGFMVWLPKFVNLLDIAINRLRFSAYNLRFLPITLLEWLSLSLVVRLHCSEPELQFFNYFKEPGSVLLFCLRSNFPIPLLKQADLLSLT